MPRRSPRAPRAGHGRRDPTPRLPRELGARREGTAAAPRWHLPPEAQPRLCRPFDLSSPKSPPPRTPRHLPLSGMRRSPDVSPRRLSDISPQLRQLKYLVVDEAIKEDLKWSRSVEDLSGGSAGLTCIEERILRITGYYGYQPWAASYKSKTPRRVSRVCGRVSPGVVPAASGARAAAQPAGAELALQLLGRGLETRVPPDPWECPTHLLPPPTRTPLSPYPLAGEVSQCGDMGTGSSLGGVAPAQSETADG